MKHLNIYKRIENMKRELGDVSEKLKPYEFVDLLKDTDFEKLPIQLFESVINELKSAIKIFELEDTKDGTGDVIDGQEIAMDAFHVQELAKDAFNGQEIAIGALDGQEIAMDALDVKYAEEIENTEKEKQIVDNTNDRTIGNLCCATKIDNKGLDEKSKHEKVKDAKVTNCESTESNLALDCGFKLDDIDSTQQYLITANLLLKTINDILIHKIYTAMLKNIHNMLNSDIQNSLAIMDEKDILKLKVRYLKLRKLGLESKIHCLKSTLILCQVIKQEKNLYGKIYGYDKLFECFVGSFLKTYFSVMKVDRKYEEKCEICDMIRIFVEKYVDAKEDVVYEI